MAFYWYRLYDLDGTDIGELNIAVLVAAGETIERDGRRLEVLEVVPVMEADSRYVGLLRVADVT